MTTDLDVSRDEKTLPDDGAYRWARERAEMLQGMYVHLLVFGVINGGLFLLNWMIRDGGTWWAVWPLAIWGLGLAVHMLVTVAPVFSTEWVDRRAEEIASKRGGS